MPQVQLDQLIPHRVPLVILDQLVQQAPPDQLALLQVLLDPDQLVPLDQLAQLARLQVQLAKEED